MTSSLPKHSSNSHLLLIPCSSRPLDVRKADFARINVCQKHRESRHRSFSSLDCEYGRKRNCQICFSREPESSLSESMDHLSSSVVGSTGDRSRSEQGRSIREKLSAAGLAGLVAYGISNTLYYTVAFLFFWFKVAATYTQPGQGLLESAKAVSSTLALVWAGSQVTKVPRAAAALFFAPVVDKVLGVLQNRFGLPSKKSVFLRIIVPLCIGIAVVLFGTITFLWM